MPITQSNINVDEGTGPDVDFVTLPTSSNRRQVVSLGSPETDADYVSTDAGGNLHVLIRPTFVVAVQYTNGTIQFTNSTISAILTNATTQFTNATIQFTNSTITAFTNATTQFTNATLQFTNSTISAVGDVASGASDAGNPVKVGFVARTALPTAVSNGQRVNSYGDKFGRGVFIPNATRDIVSTNFTVVTTTAEVGIVSNQGSGVFTDIVSFVVTNTGNTQTVATIRSAVAGSTIIAFNIPSMDTRGAVFSTPLPQASSNNTWTIQTNNSVIVHVSTQFIKNQ